MGATAAGNSSLIGTGDVLHNAKLILMSAAGEIRKLKLFGLTGLRGTM